MSDSFSPAEATARQPRALVQVNGTTIGAPISFETEFTGFNEPSTFRFQFPLTALPQGADLNWWSSTTDEIDVEVFAGFPSDPTSFTASDLTSIFYGRADEAAAALDTTILTVNGRDLSSKLTDNKSAEKYTNQTSSQVATTLAGKYGLTPQVTDTTTKVGKYYEIDHVDWHDDRTDWDILVWLARQEQFVCYVQGKTLYFQAAPTASSPSVKLTYQPGTGLGAASANFDRCSLTRELTVAKGIKVVVHSWNAKHKKGYQKTAGKGGKNAQTYTYNIPGLDPDKAQQRADQIAAEIVAHLLKMTVEGPGDGPLALTDVFGLTGTATAWDTTYFPDSIKRSMSPEEGYRLVVAAKNKPPALDESAT